MGKPSSNGRLRVEYVPLDTVAGDPANPKDHDVGAIHASIGRFGYLEPVIVDERTGRLVAGHGRVAALTQLHAAGHDPPAGVTVDGGRWLLPAVRGWQSRSDADARAALVALNRTVELGGWDVPALVALLSDLAASEGGLDGTGYDGDDLDTLLADLDADTRGDGPDPDEVPEPLPEPVSRPGDVWTCGAHVLAVADATHPDVWDAVLPDPAALAVTSFPYGIGADYGGPADTIDQLRSLLAVVPGLMAAHVRDGGYAVTNFGDIVPARDIVGTDDVCEYPMAVEYWPAFRAAGWLLHTRRIWVKPHPATAAPWTSSSNRAATDWEHLWTWRKPGPHRDMRLGTLTPFGVWSTTGGDGPGARLGMEKMDTGKAVHPAAFPVALADAAIRVHSSRADIVVDPFAGTGTTLVAAQRLGRRSVGIELSPQYADLAVRRLQQHVGTPAVRVGDGATMPADHP